MIWFPGRILNHQLDNCLNELPDVDPSALQDQVDAERGYGYDGLSEHRMRYPESLWKHQGLQRCCRREPVFKCQSVLAAVQTWRAIYLHTGCSIGLGTVTPEMRMSAKVKEEV